MNQREVILACCIFVIQLVSGKIYRCKNVNHNATESHVWNCCGGKLFNMTSQYCSTSGPRSCIGSKVVSWCRNGNCIYKSWRCDDVNDCRDGSDEFECGSCAQNQFRCMNAKCLHTSYVCNGENDCGDGSDEFGCPKIGNNGACRFDQYRCRNHSCVSMKAVCDSKNDCGDCSDEQGCSKDRIVVRSQQAIDKDSECSRYEVKKENGGESVFTKQDTWKVMLLCIVSTTLIGT